ncbi:hypothetical protein GCM10027591_14770 [Zhihengliuella somnathii]
MTDGPHVLSFKEMTGTRRAQKRRGLFRRPVETEQFTIWNIQINDRPLQQWVRDWSGALDMPAEMADLRSTFPAAGLLRIDHLLGLEQGPGPHRIGLLFCPLCRSEACGYLSCELHIDEDAVTWDHFAWEDTVKGAPRFTPVAGAEVLSFDPAAYRKTLLELRGELNPVEPGTLSPLPTEPQHAPQH